MLNLAGLLGHGCIWLGAGFLVHAGARRAPPSSVLEPHLHLPLCQAQGFGDRPSLFQSDVLGFSVLFFQKANLGGLVEGADFKSGPGTWKNGHNQNFSLPQNEELPPLLRLLVLGVSLLVPHFEFCLQIYESFTTSTEFWVWLVVFEVD